MQALRRIGRSALEVRPLALGANVFGWTADAETSFDVLDRYVDAGGDFIDTADSYSFWAPGNRGGESESIIGAWLAARRRRDDLVIATKVSQHPEFAGIDPATIERGMTESQRRLGVDYIDLYYAHFDEPEKPLEPTVAAFSALVDAGRARYLGISNFSAARIREWLRIADEGGYHRPVALQPKYNLMDRDIEADLVPLAAAEDLGLVTYWALARGFLTGKYRSGADDSDSPRAEPAAAYLDGRGRRVLEALDEVAAAHGVSAAAVAIAWVAAQPGVAAPIASARNPAQLTAMLESVELPLSESEMQRLGAASTTVPASES